jgi:hypothetical protein
MSFVNCILSNKLLTDKQKDELVKEYNEVLETYTGTMGDITAASAASQKYIQIKSSQLAKKKLNAMKDVLVWDKLKSDIDKRAKEIDKLKSGNKIIAKAYGKFTKKQAIREKLQTVSTYHQVLERNATLAIAEQIEKYRSKIAGVTQDVDGFKNVIRSLLGEDVKNPTSKADAQAIRNVFDNLHKMYEGAGGVIGKLENYFPQVHNANLVNRAGFGQWRAKIISRIDINKMIDPDTGLPFTARRLDEVLPDVYQGIVTNGLDDVARRANEGKQTFGRGGGAAMRHSSSRFFHFKSADDFIAYNAEFGNGDAGLFDAMMGHISVMTRDIAIMEQLGPKPESQMARLQMVITGEEGTESQVVQGMYDILAGRNSYNGKLPLWYDVTAALQNVLRSSLLGGAPIAAMSDSFYTAFTAKINGIPATKAMGQWLKMLNPADATDRRIARRLGLVASASSGNALQSARFQNDADGRGITGWMAGFTHRASGMATITDASRTSIILSTQGYLSELKTSGVKFDDLPDAMKEAFGRWDIQQADYDNFMKAETYIEPESGADFIRSEEIAKINVNSARKLEMWLMEMSNQASNEPLLLTRAITTGAALGRARTGDPGRAFWSSFMMFKSFGITVMINHLIPTIRRMGDPTKGGERYLRMGALLLGTTLLGAAALQTRDVVYGKTLRDMDNPQFWMSAALQGGGFGIFGDFLFSDQSRFGNTLVETLVGPVAGTMADAVKVFKGNFDRALDEDAETKFFADLYQMAERNIPMIKLWYTRLLLERLVLDHVEKAIDPNYQKRMTRIENRMKKEMGQEFWWKPSK